MPRVLGTVTAQILYEHRSRSIDDVSGDVQVSAWFMSGRIDVIHSLADYAPVVTRGTERICDCEAVEAVGGSRCLQLIPLSCPPRLPLDRRTMKGTRPDRLDSPTPMRNASTSSSPASRAAFSPFQPRRCIGVALYAREPMHGYCRS